MDDAEFSGLIARARTGDDVAVATLLRSFEEDVRMIVRRRLPRRLRTQFESMDFVQAVWKSVFTGGDRLETEFRTPGQFRGYLAGVARNKVLQEYRRKTQFQKYDLAREEPLYVQRGDREEVRDVVAPDPSPSQHAQAGDCYEKLVGGRPPLEVEVVELRRQGLTFEQIADRVGLNERSVRRVLEAVWRRMEDD